MNHPELKEGETYIGCIGNSTGTLHHIILLPGDSDDADWETQMQWAKSIGGDLPDKIEFAMLNSIFSSHFRDDFYWSNARSLTLDKTPNGDCWYQQFPWGVQATFPESIQLRARAVRRAPVHLPGDNHLIEMLESIKQEINRLTTVIEELKNREAASRLPRNDRPIDNTDDQFRDATKLVIKP